MFTYTQRVKGHGEGETWKRKGVRVVNVVIQEGASIYCPRIDEEMNDGLSKAPVL